MAYSLSKINDAVRSDPQGFVQESDEAYNRKIEAAARKIADNLSKSRIVLLSGPSGSGKTTTAKKIEAKLKEMGINSHAVSMDNYFKTVDPEPGGADRLRVPLLHGYGPAQPALRRPGPGREDPDSQV